MPRASPTHRLQRHGAAGQGRSCGPRTETQRSRPSSDRKFSNASTLRNVTCSAFAASSAGVTHNRRFSIQHEQLHERDRVEARRDEKDARRPTSPATTPPSTGPSAGPRRCAVCTTPIACASRPAAPNRRPSRATARRSRRTGPGARAARTRATAAWHSAIAAMSTTKLTSDRSTMILRPNRSARRPHAARGAPSAPASRRGRARSTARWRRRR